MPAEAVQVVADSTWTPAMVLAVFAGITGMITAIAGLLSARATAKRQEAAAERQEAAAMKQEAFAEKQEAATEKVATKLVEVHDLVNGGTLSMLQQIDRLTTRVAALTHEENDAVEAQAATLEVSDKQDEIAAATAKREGAEAAAAAAEKAKG